MTLSSIIDIGTKEYQIEHISKETVCVGGETELFVPRLDMTCFLGESKLGLIPQVQSVTETVKLDSLEAGNSTIKFLWKATPVITDFNERGGIDIILTLLKKPAVPYIDFGYDATKLIPYHQPELTQAEIDEGAIRPDHVINSIAWYHNTKGGLVTPDDTKKYITTGKAGHTYRMLATDAKGNKTWTNWTLELGNISRLNLDKVWLNKATYPVTIAPVGDTFGYTSLGASDTSTYDGIWSSINEYSPAANGTATGMSVGAFSSHSSATGIKLGLYTGSGFVDLAGGQEAVGSIPASASKDWYSANFGSSYNIFSASAYWVAFIAESSSSEMEVCYDDTDVDRRYTVGSSYATGLDDPATWTSSTSDRTWSIYCTYTPSGGATDYPISTTVNLSLAASINRDFDIDRAINSGLTIAATILKSKGRTIISTVNLTLAPTFGRALTFARATTSNLSIAGNIAKGWGRAIATTCNLTIGMSLTKSLDFIRATTSNLTLSPVIARALTYSRATTTGITSAFTLSFHKGYTVITSAGITLASSFAKSKGFTRAITTGLTAGITVARKFAMTKVFGSRESRNA